MTDHFSFSLTSLIHKNLPTETFQFGKGIHVIYGEGGTGKSEFAHALASLEESNHIWKIELKNKIQQSQIVLQNPDMQILFPSVDEEISFNLECVETDSVKIQKRKKQLYDLPLPLVDKTRHPVTLSGGEKEILNLVTSLSTIPDLLVIDDAFSFLNKELKIDVINVLKETRFIVWFTSDWSDLEFAEYKWELLENKLNQIPVYEKRAYSNHPIDAGNLDLKISDLTFGFPGNEKIFENFNYRAENFRCLGISGLNGSGKTTLAGLITGSLVKDSGNIEFSINGKAPKVGYLDQFPEKMIGMKCPDEFLDQLVRYELFDPENFDDLVQDLRHFGIIWDDIKGLPGPDLPWTILRLSVNFILARADYELLILDEPTFGLGWEQKSRLAGYYHKYLKEKFLVLISHDYDFLHNICNFICLVERMSKE